MTTPTREQLIEQAIQGHAGTRMAMQWLFDQAIKAGRDQGLREAKEVCEAFARKTLEAQSGEHSDLSNVMLRQVAELGHRECAAAIEQLRGE